MRPRDVIIGSASLASAVLAWEIAVCWSGVSSYVIPAPLEVSKALISEWHFLWSGIKCTATELVLGAALGTAVAFFIGILSSEWPIFAALVYPFAIISQVVPKIALVPILLIWLGHGLAPKLIVVSLIAFFPMLQNTVVGLSSVSSQLVDVMRAARASRLQILLKVRIPSSMFLVASAFRICAIYGVVGAITAEFVGANEGMGYLILLYKNGMETPKLFAALTVASGLGGIAWIVAVCLERLAQAAVLRSIEDVRW